jgi:hypothetical protein
MQIAEKVNRDADYEYSGRTPQGTCTSKSRAMPGAQQNGVAADDRNPAFPLVELGGFEPPTS